MKTYSNTYAYRIISEYLDKGNVCNAKSLKKHLNNQINKSTIYRILSRLFEKGYIHSFVDDQGITWYSKCKNCTPKSHFDNHPHFKCIYCGKIECLYDLKVNLPKSSKYAFLSQKVFLKGECQPCQHDKIKT